MLSQQRPGAAIHETIWETTMAAFPTVQSVKGYAGKLLDAFYAASVASVLAFCALLFLTAIFAMAIAVKAIDVPPLHPPQ